MGKRISQRDGYAERSTLPGEWSLDVHRDNIESLPFRTATPAKELCGAILIEANLATPV